MERITWSGIALHAGALPGHPASHGCIRLHDDFAIRLWGLTKRGTRVIIAPNDIQPVEIANLPFFIATPRRAETQGTITESAATTAAARHPFSMANADRQLADTQAPASIPATLGPRKVAPVSVFVSRKSSKLFVRQGFTPLFDTPVRIQDPERSLGTHVFTVMRSHNVGETLRWTVVSMPEKTPHGASKRGAQGKQIVEIALSVPSPDKAKAALDRIEIPRDVIERISELLTPGSSLIISDYGISDETGSDTDFIVLTH
jgi:hypothetical protein